MSKNQFDYLTNLSKQGGGNAIWAQNQLQGATIAPDQTTQAVASHTASIQSPFGTSGATNTQSPFNPQPTSPNLGNGQSNSFQVNGTLNPDQMKVAMGLSGMEQFNYLQGAGASQAAPAPNQPAPVVYGGYTYGTDPVKDKQMLADQKLYATDPVAKQAEIERALGVYQGQKSRGEDFSAAYSYLTKNLGVNPDDYSTAVGDSTDTQTNGAFGFQPSFGQPVNTPTRDYSFISDQVMNDLATQRQAIEQQLAQLKQSSELAVNQNNTFLQDQIKQMEENRIKIGNEITNFQNRRGGFYSGGLDFQTATNNQAFTEAQGGLTKDIAARNADIWSRNSLLAQQAADNISLLTRQAPDKIRQLVQEQMERDRLAAIQEAGLTGNWNGQRTIDGKQIDWNMSPDNPANIAQNLQNQLAQLQLADYPEESKARARILQQEVEKGQIDIQTAQLNLKEITDPNSVTNQAAKLDLQIKQLEAQNLPELQKLELQQLKKQIAQIGAAPYRSQTEIEMDNVRLQTAQEQLKQMQNQGNAQMDEEKRGLTDGLRSGQLTPAAAIQQIDDDVRLGFYTSAQAEVLKSIVHQLTPSLESSKTPAIVPPEQQDQILSGKALDEQYKQNGKGKPEMDWKRWYNAANGRLAGTDFDTWARLYGPVIK